MYEYGIRNASRFGELCYLIMTIVIMVFMCVWHRLTYIMLLYCRVLKSYNRFSSIIWKTFAEFRQRFRSGKKTKRKWRTTGRHQHGATHFWSKRFVSTNGRVEHTHAYHRATGRRESAGRRIRVTTYARSDTILP